MDEKHEPDGTTEDEVDDETAGTVIAAVTEALPSVEEEEPEGKMGRKNLAILALALLLAAGLGIGWLALRGSGGSGNPRTAAQGQTGGRNAATAAPSTGKDVASGDGRKDTGGSGKDAPSSDKKDGTSEDGKKDATATANPSTGPTAPGGTEGGSGSPGGGAAPSNPPSGSGTAAPSKKTCPDCGGSGTAQTGTSTVTDSAAWDEWVVDSAAWDEPVYEWRDRYVCYDDGAVFYPGEEAALSAHLDALVEAGYNGSSYVETYQVQVDTVHHDETGHYAHHDAVTHTEPVYGTCPTCGGSGQV